MYTPGSRPNLPHLVRDSGGTDSENEEPPRGVGMTSDQELSRAHHFYHHHHHSHHHLPPSSKQAPGPRFKVVRYEEYRQKWGTKGKASVWDEHLPGVPTSLPPKSEIELKNEQNVLPTDEELFQNVAFITFSHQHCHQHPILSKRSHYERIALKMIHYSKCDQARKPNANGKVEICKMEDDRQYSPRHSSKKKKQTSRTDGKTKDSNGGTNVQSNSSPPDPTLTNSTAAAPSCNSDEGIDVAPPPVTADVVDSVTSVDRETLPNSSTPKMPSSLEIDLSVHDESGNPNPPNPPTSPVPSDLAPVADDDSQSSDNNTSEQQNTLTSGSVPPTSAVKKGRFTVLSREEASPPPQNSETKDSQTVTHTASTLTTVTASDVQSIPNSKEAIPSAKEISQNARDVAIALQQYQPSSSTLFSPENVQLAFNWIGHFRSNKTDTNATESEVHDIQKLDFSLDKEDANFQVTLDNIAQAVFYLTDTKNNRTQHDNKNTSTSSTSNTGTKSTKLTNGLQSPPVTNVPSSQQSSHVVKSSVPLTNGPQVSANHQVVESRLEARIHGVTDKFQEVLLNTLKSEMDPLNALLSQYRSALAQRDSEISNLNQQLRPFLSDDFFQQNVSRQNKMTRPE